MAPADPGAFLAVSNFEWSLTAPGAGASFVSTFVSSNYYNNVFLPVLQNYSRGRIDSVVVRFTPSWFVGSQ
jgi:hypothetical protein